MSNRIVGNHGGPHGAGGPARPFSLAQAKEALDGILARINNKKNDIANMDVSRPGQAPVATAIKLDAREAKALIAELGNLPPGLERAVLEKALPQRLQPARKEGVFLTKAAAKELNAHAADRGVEVRFEAKKPVLPMAMPMPMPMPGPVVDRPNAAPIEGIVPLQEIKASAPADAKVVARINEISAKAIAKEAGKGENVLASVVNILDMIAPVATSLLPAAGDDAATKAKKQASLAAMKEDLAGTHLTDQAFIHQLQVIHAQLLQFKGMITMGNEIVVNEGAALRPEVKAAVEKGFDVQVRSLPLKRDPEGAAAAMNASIEKATTVYEAAANGGEPKKVQDGLKDVVKPDFVATLDAASVATLTALLDWRFVFDKELTEKGDVKNADGSVSKKDLMELTTGDRVNPADNRHQEVPEMEVAEHGGMIYVKIPYDDKIPHDENRWGGPPPSRIYRIIGAPLVGGADREKALERMIGGLAENDPLRMRYEDRHGTIVMPRIKSEAEADPFALLEHGGVDAKNWVFPLLDGQDVSFTKGIHKGAIEDTEKGSIVQFVTVGGLESLGVAIPAMPFELRADVPHYNAIVVELNGDQGRRLPIKVAEWTIEDFKAATDPTSNR